MADCSKLEDFLRERKRMCKSFDSLYQSWDQGLCDGCPLNKENNCLFYNEVVDGESIQKAVNLVQKWSDEHPAPNPKTYADDFFEKFPNATRKTGNIPFGCRGTVYGFYCQYYDHEKKFDQSFCIECWLEPYTEQEE